MTFVQLATRGIGFTVEPWTLDPKNHVRIVFAKAGYKNTSIIVRVKTLIYSKYEESRLCGFVLRYYLSENQNIILREKNTDYNERLIKFKEDEYYGN
jgi:hypothetical protein